ncbi:exodeoxyribonuclease V alpha subunit [Spiroplasma gladiatoris]|uniref:Exodeoxyribonuclease V alpha subunit n=1 Tax=Spiroplasma gladiatoris TaxID=2143 RepID=A0A4V1AQ90_9MOLU|nr:AAA family ATPase [Spiroplasma gladiatoris]QBQ07669.1 exodeoxyribonuclease V alpha subunit [Spiroplasma gladiatoris]
MTEIKGKIKNFIYNNEGFGIAVFTLIDNETRSIVIRGEISSLRMNIFYVLSGESVIDRRTNKTIFEVSKFKKLESSSKESCFKYLISPLFPTIGKQLATRIVNYYEDHVFQKILKDPNSLYQIEKITEAQVNIIIQQVEYHFKENKLLETFEAYDLKIDFYTKLEKLCKDKEEVLDILKNDFYKFAFENNLKPFSEVDKVAIVFNQDINSEVRVSWWALHIVNDILIKTGNTFTDLTTLRKEIFKIFTQLNQNELSNKLLYAKKNNILYFENKKIYSKESYEDEKIIASSLNEIENKKTKNNDYDFENLLIEVEIYIEETLQIKNFKYNNEQILALKNFLENNVSIITGGPGTGKTTVINGIIKLYELVYKDKDFSIVAPTGRAASRITESSDYNASTIHRLLKFLGNNSFEHNSKNPLIKKMLIIDESSMIDNHLFASMFLGIEGIEKLVLVGDVDQLPSVSYGNAFEDIIKSEKFSITKLLINNRQVITDQSNSIIDLATAIKNNSIQKFNFNNLNNVVTYFSNDTKESLEYIKKIYLQNRPSNILDELVHLQIIAPMYKEDLGIDELNNFIQAIVNPKTSTEYKKANSIYRPNDKVMYTENDSFLKIFNGDVGYIDKIFLDNKKYKNSKVFFNEEEKELSSAQFSKLKLSYACSIHKTQGSEYNTVILVLDNSNRFSSWIINKKMIYTAITRAKKHLYIVGDKQLFLNACSKEMKPRLTTLIERIFNLNK